MASKIYFSTLFLFLALMAFPIHASEALQLERQLRILRKPAVKTIKTLVGDTYDCVNIREQPSLDHPSLKNHKIQMQPSSHLKGEYVGGTSSAASSRVLARGITVDCPKGTVPIRRVGRKDLIRAKSFTESFLKIMQPMSQDSPGQHFALLRSKPNYNPSIIGVRASMSIHALNNVQAFQSTSGRMWMESGTNSIQAGWMISPKLYGDYHPRQFIFWKNKDSGCFNLLCDPGFVQVSQDTPVDILLNQTSTPQEQFEIQIRIEKDMKTSCWWLVANEDVYIGYWPSGLLPDLDKNGANYIAWGGMTTTSPPTAPSPQMGSGYYGTFDFQEAAYMCLLQIVDSSKTWLNPHEADLEDYYDNKSCYYSRYDGYQGGKNGHVVFYGGPGGNCGA